ncbi:MAG: methylmalonyl-CoA mutase family protein [Myxococcales bacterium]|nr:methylmalonyl-CoA mutase family protein [Myxococcota bacterium]MDW8281292.1 methylmalonyl-CoA mutase family protein [Myxococcales bacterium]
MSVDPPGRSAHEDLPADSYQEVLRQRLAALRERVARRQGPLRRACFQTDAGLQIRDVYTPLDAPASQLGQRHLDEIGLPGEPPFTRGIQPTMYRGRLWTMRQYAGFGSAAESNARYRFLLEQGQTGLSVAFDLPTQMGRDPDHEMSRGEVGRVGVSIATLDDMEELLAGLPLERITTSMTINATAATLLCLYIAVADRRGVPRRMLGGTIQNDILKEYIARGTYIYPPRPSLRLITDTFAFCREEVPGWNMISISGYHIREAGSDAVQEVAFTLANGIAYVEAALAAGLPVDSFAPRLSFFFNAHNNLLEEVAKFRAARRLWAKIMRDRFGARDERSLMLRFHAQTAGSMLTAQQPLCNLVRTTVQALAAVLGGCQSLHVNAYDEALALPTEASALLALRTQQILAHESGVADFVDALGGSYAVEAMTDEIEREAAAYIARIDEMGGMVAAIEQRYPQSEIERRAYEYQCSVERRERIVVGVNEFREESGAASPPRLHHLDPHLEATRVQQVRAFRAGRDAARTHAALSALTEAARRPPSGDNNLVVYILHAVNARATVGEIADAMRVVFGEYDNFSR